MLFRADVGELKSVRNFSGTATFEEPRIYA